MRTQITIWQIVDFINVKLKKIVGTSSGQKWKSRIKLSAFRKFHAGNKNKPDALRLGLNPVWSLAIWLNINYTNKATNKFH